MDKKRKSILEFLRDLFKKNGDAGEFPSAPEDETVKKLVNRAMGEDAPAAQEGAERPEPDNAEGSGARDDSADIHGESAAGEEDKGKGDKKGKESCPYATKRAIVESIAEIKRFAEEHKLATAMLKSLLQLLAEIALGAMRGKVSRQVLDALLKALTYELAVEEAFKKGHNDGRTEFIEERYPADDDGLPHINGGILHPEGTSIFDVAAEARR